MCFIPFNIDLHQRWPAADGFHYGIQSHFRAPSECVARLGIKGVMAHLCEKRMALVKSYRTHASASVRYRAAHSRDLGFQFQPLNRLCKLSKSVIYRLECEDPAIGGVPCLSQLGGYKSHIGSDIKHQ